MIALQTYPNVLGHARGDENRGGLRAGVVVDNMDTDMAGTAGFPAMVTHEENGWARFYIYMTKLDSSVSGPEQTWWQGPYRALSEEIEEMKYD